MNTIARRAAPARRRRWPHCTQRGSLAFEQPWRQESITGGRFTGWLTRGGDGELIPHIRGRAFITGDSTLRFDPADPFRFGIGG